MVEAVPLRNGAPALTDIPGMLRRAADKIEAGEHGEVNAALLVLPVDGDYPLIFGWGDVEGKNEPIIQFELAKAWMIANLVVRM